MSCLLMGPGHPVLLPEAGQGWDCSRAPFCLPLPAQAWPACPPLLSLLPPFSWPQEPGTLPGELLTHGPADPTA